MVSEDTRSVLAGLERQSRETVERDTAGNRGKPPAPETLKDIRRAHHYLESVVQTDHRCVLFENEGEPWMRYIESILCDVVNGHQTPVNLTWDFYNRACTRSGGGE